MFINHAIAGIINTFLLFLDSAGRLEFGLFNVLPCKAD